MQWARYCASWRFDVGWNTVGTVVILSLCGVIVLRNASFFAIAYRLESFFDRNGVVMYRRNGIHSEWISW